MKDEMRMGHIRKNIFAYIFTAALVALFAALVVLYPAAQKEYRIIYINKTTERMAFWETLTAGMETAAKETGVRLEIRGVKSENDVLGQNELIEQAIKEKPDAIILSAADYRAQDELCSKIVDAGIVFVTADSDISSGAKSCFVGTNSYLAGFRTGEALSALVHDEGKIALISSVKISQTGIDRVSGFLGALSERQRKNVAGPYYSGSETENAYEITKEILRQNPDLDGIAGMNEPSFSGAVLAVKDSGITDIAVVGIDSSIYSIQAMEEGIVDAIIAQNPFNIGYLSVTAAVDVLNGKSVPPHVDTGEYVITKDNMYEPENQKLLFIFSEESGRRQ